jgi:FkbM family methyltransferase
VNSILKSLVQKLFKKAGYSITRLAPPRANQYSLPFVPLWRSLSLDEKIHIAPYLAYSKSQIAQDLFVISQTLTRDIAPYFVEFGAANGISLSNTYLLETRLGWNGIVAEPSHASHDELQRNRTCHIDLRCVAERSGKSVEFLQNFRPAYSSMAAFADKYYWDKKENLDKAVRYQVTTVSLNDLLEQHDAPRRIGYLSIDTEGSELAILKAFDFSRYSFDVITIEHNENTRPGYRDALHQLLVPQGYRRVRENITSFEDWYVCAE